MSSAKKLATQLHTAVMDGNIDGVKALLAQGVPVDAKDPNDPYGRSCLHIAMSSGNKDLVEVLLKAGANPRKEDEENGRIPLHYSVLNGWALTAEFILSRDPDPISLANYADDYGDTPLHLAVEAKSKPCIALLLRFGAEVSAQNNDNETPFKVANQEMKQILSDICNAEKDAIVADIPGQIIKGAAENMTLHKYVAAGDLRQIRSMLTSKNVNSLDEIGRTCLYVAVDSNNIEVVRFLISNKADINLGIKSGSLISSPLHLAATMGSQEIAEALLSKGANVNILDTQRKTPLHLASEWKRTVVAALLLESGANIEATDVNQRTPLHIAAMAGRRPIVQMLLERGANPNCKDKNKRTPLHLASQWNRHLIVPMLLEGKANINEVDENKQTALHIAARYNKLQMIHILFTGNPDITLVDKDGNNAVRLASIFGKIAAVQAIMDFQSAICLSPTSSSSSSAFAELEEKRKLDNQKNEEMKQAKLKKEILAAAKSGDYAAAEKCVEMGVSVDAKQQALCVAARNGHLEVMGILTDKDDIDIEKCVDAKGLSLLHLAVLSGSQEVTAEILMMEAVPIDSKDPSGNTAMHLAAEKGFKKIIKDLLSNDASVTELNQEGLNSLHIATQFGHNEIVTMFLEEDRKLARSKDKDGRTALHIASQYGHVDIINKILNFDSSIINDIDNNLRTALFVAAKFNQVKAGCCLIMRGAVTSDSGCGNPLRTGDENTQSALRNALEDKKESEAAMNKQQSVQMIADRVESMLNPQNDIRHLKDWIDRGNDVNVKLQEDSTPLHIASLNGYLKAVKLLVGSGRCNVNAEDQFLQTPLHCAAMKGHLDIVEFLLVNGADPNSPDIEEQTPIDWADLKGFASVVKVLWDASQGQLPTTSASADDDDVTSISSSEPLEELAVPSREPVSAPKEEEKKKKKKRKHHSDDEDDSENSGKEDDDDDDGGKNKNDDEDSDIDDDDDFAKKDDDDDDDDENKSQSKEDEEEYHGHQDEIPLYLSGHVELQASVYSVPDDDNTSSSSSHQDQEPLPEPSSATSVADTETPVSYTSSSSSSSSAAVEEEEESEADPDKKNKKKGKKDPPIMLKDMQKPFRHSFYQYDEYKYEVESQYLSDEEDGAGGNAPSDGTIVAQEEIVLLAIEEPLPSPTTSEGGNSDYEEPHYQPEIKNRTPSNTFTSDEPPPSKKPVVEEEKVIETPIPVAVAIPTPIAIQVEEPPKLQTQKSAPAVPSAPIKKVAPPPPSSIPPRAASQGQSLSAGPSPMVPRLNIGSGGAGGGSAVPSAIPPGSLSAVITTSQSGPGGSISPRLDFEYQYVRMPGGNVVSVPVSSTAEKAVKIAPEAVEQDSSRSSRKKEKRKSIFNVFQRKKDK